MKSYRFIRIDITAEENMTEVLAEALRDDEEIHSITVAGDEVIVLTESDSLV